MAISQTQVDADLLHILQQSGDTVSIDGAAAIPVMRRNRVRNDELADEGLRDVYRFSIYVRAADVGTEPVAGELATLDSVDYRILPTNMGPLERLLRLDLGEEFAV